MMTQFSDAYLWYKGEMSWYSILTDLPTAWPSFAEKNPIKFLITHSCWPSLRHLITSNGISFIFLCEPSTLVLLKTNRESVHYFSLLTHWGRMRYICISDLTIIGSDNGLSPGRCQAIIWTNEGILIGSSLGINFSEILIEILIFSFEKMHLKMSSTKWCLFRLGLSVLKINGERLHWRMISQGPVEIYKEPKHCQEYCLNCMVMYFII